MHMEERQNLEYGVCNLLSFKYDAQPGKLYVCVNLLTKVFDNYGVERRRVLSGWCRPTEDHHYLELLTKTRSPPPLVSSQLLPV